MNIRKAIFILGAAGIFSFCSPRLFSPSPADIETAKEILATANDTTLVKGHMLYQNKCGSCHYLYQPQSYTASVWTQELNEMTDRAKLSEKEHELIKVYLLTYSRKN